MEFAATDKHQSELNLKPSPAGEGGLAKRIVFKCFAKTDEVFLCPFLVRTRNRRKKAWGLRP